jgi:stage II sporulation protein D
LTGNFKRRKILEIILPLLLVVALVSIYVASCRIRNVPPDRPPAAEGGIQQIPPEISRGERKEPEISVYIAENETVVKMPMEEYITGVVAGEMDPQWPLEALAAQAIIARTFTLKKIAETGGAPQHNAHASTNVEEFQAYSAEDITDRVREAVALTRGKVICYNNQFIHAWFNAYAGPRTALADEGLDFKEGNPPYIQIVESLGKKIIPAEEGLWSVSFPAEQVRAAVEEATGKDPGALNIFEIEERGPSGRVTSFNVNGQKVSGPALRLALGSTEMRSTFLEELDMIGEEIKMRGTGYGHGVGVCQWGARAMAEEGRSPEEIVDYFYKNIDVVSLWD